MGSLSGVKVLDLSGYIAAPYGCSLLADLGAEVIKIEPPAGDNLRRYPSTLPGESRAFLGVNRGKRGLVLDLKQPQGLAVLMRLVDTADVLVHNFRPDVPVRLGIDYERLKARNPRLVYGVVTGYGESGPMKNHAGYDQVLQTMTGICAEQGTQRSGAGSPPEIVFGSIVDFYAASLLALGIASALFSRGDSGQGRYVGVSLLSAALAMQSARMVWAEGEPRDIDRDMRSGGITGLHPTKEGYLYLSANTPHFWNELCAGLGLPELAQDTRYDSIAKRALCAGALIPKIRSALKARTALEWESLFGDRVPCAASRSLTDMFDHPQVQSEGLVTSFPHPDLGRYRGIASAFADGAGGAPQAMAAPKLGQHSAEILAAHGYSEAEIVALIGADLVR